MLSDIMANLGNLVRNEAALARAEVSENISKAVASIGAILLALALGLAGLNILATSAVALLVLTGLAPHWAMLFVGSALLIVALAIFYSAKSALHQIGIVPTRAAQNVKRDAAAIKDTFNDK